MISFLNDYNEIGHPAILDEFVKLQKNKYVGYSEDIEVNKAMKLIKSQLENENIDIHFTHTGTMANVFGILFSLNRFESVITANTGHIVNTENGSIEAIGLPIVQVQEKDGKVTVEELEKVLYRTRHEYSSKPGLVYISNATELGTVYKKSELKKLHDFCRENEIYLFMDGARLGTALMSDASDLEFKDLTKYLDIFTIGGNKNGFVFGEAVVIVNDKIKTGYERRLIKQRGSLLSKGFLYGIQFRKAFENGLFFENAKNAVKMAKKLEEVFIENNIKLLNKVEANLVFVKLPIYIHEKLSKEFLYDYEEVENNMLKCRFVTTWNTKEEEIVKIKKELSIINK